MVFLIAVLSLIVGCVLVIAAFVGSDYLLAARRPDAEPRLDWLAGTPFAQPGSARRRGAIAFSKVVATLAWVVGVVAAVGMVMLGLRELLRLAV